MKALIIDINRCNGCYNCQIACKDEHVGNDWTPRKQVTEVMPLTLVNIDNPVYY